MRSVQTLRFAQSLMCGGSPAGVAVNGTVAGGDFLRLVIPHPPSCVPWLPRRYPASSLLRTLCHLLGTVSRLASGVRPRGADAQPRPGRFLCGPPDTASWPRRVLLSQQVSLLHPTVFRAFCLQPPLVAPGSVCFPPGLTVCYLGHPVCRDRTASGASPVPSRLATTTGRIEFLAYGLLVHFRLLPTSPCGDAVTFGYQVQTKLWQDLHLADSVRSEAHWDRLPACHLPNRQAGSLSHGTQQSSSFSWAIKGSGASIAGTGERRSISVVGVGLWAAAR